MSGPNLNWKSATVGGTGQYVRRSRVVWMMSDFTVGEMTVGNSNSYQPYGVAQEWSRNPPGTPFDNTSIGAASGDDILVYANGSEGKVQLGGTVVAGQTLTIDTNALAVQMNSFNASPAIWCIGTAKEAGSAGDVIRFDCNIFC
jgi:hypothetical protein